LPSMSRSCQPVNTCMRTACQLCACNMTAANKLNQSSRGYDWTQRQLSQMSETAQIMNGVCCVLHIDLDTCWQLSDRSHGHECACQRFVILLFANGAMLLDTRLHFVHNQ
jgi:hypothetical protein